MVVLLKAGSFMLHPAKTVHWDGSAGDEPFIVQIIGMGPAQTVQVDAKQSMWRMVSRESGIEDRGVCSRLLFRIFI